MAHPVYSRLLYAYLYTAARRNEALTLEWDDVDFENRTVRLWTGKRRDGVSFDIIPMVSMLYDMLVIQKELTGYQNYVFLHPVTGNYIKSPKRIMPSLCKQAGVKGFGFHAIRHLSASIMKDEGVDINDIKNILRHKSVKTTERYIHSLGNLSRITRHLDKAFDLEGNSGPEKRKGILRLVRKKVNEKVNETSTSKSDSFTSSQVA